MTSGTLRRSPNASTSPYTPICTGAGCPCSGAEGATRRMSPYAAGAASHNKPWRAQHAQPTNRTFPASDPAFSACRRRAGRRRAAYLLYTYGTHAPRHTVNASPRHFPRWEKLRQPARARSTRVVSDGRAPGARDQAGLLQCPFLAHSFTAMGRAPPLTWQRGAGPSLTYICFGMPTSSSRKSK